MFSSNELISNRFRVIELLYEGGMGGVYKVFDSYLDRFYSDTRNIEYVIKTPLDSVKKHYKWQEIFYGEFLAGQYLSHSNVVKTYGYFTHNDLPYILLEFIPGVTLSQCKKESDYTIDKLSIIKQLLCVVNYFHKIGVVHCDLKPKNIMLANNGLLKIIDLGLMQAVDNKLPFRVNLDNFKGFNHRYSSLELKKGAGLSILSDVYSACLIIHYLLEGDESLLVASQNMPLDTRSELDVKFKRVKDRKIMELVRSGLSVNLNRRKNVIKPMLNYLLTIQNISDLYIKKSSKIFFW